LLSSLTAKDRDRVSSVPRVDRSARFRSDSVADIQDRIASIVLRQSPRKSCWFTGEPNPIDQSIKKKKTGSIAPRLGTEHVCPRASSASLAWPLSRGHALLFPCGLAHYLAQVHFALPRPIIWQLPQTRSPRTLCQRFARPATRSRLVERRPLAIFPGSGRPITVPRQLTHGPCSLGRPRRCIRTRKEDQDRSTTCPRAGGRRTSVLGRRPRAWSVAAARYRLECLKSEALILRSDTLPVPSFTAVP
jgi:hypothetical protein